MITTHTSFKIISRPRIHCSRNSSHHISLIKITKSPQNTIKQMDIFPTLLDLTGIQSSWRGVGRSLLMSDSIANSNREKERRENAQKISDIIIHSDYLKHTNYQTKTKISFPYIVLLRFYYPFPYVQLPLNRYFPHPKSLSHRHVTGT